MFNYYVWNLEDLIASFTQQYLRAFIVDVISSELESGVYSPNLFSKCSSRSGIVWICSSTYIYTTTCCFITKVSQTMEKRVCTYLARPKKTWHTINWTCLIPSWETTRVKFMDIFRYGRKTLFWVLQLQNKVWPPH